MLTMLTKFLASRRFIARNWEIGMFTPRKACNEKQEFCKAYNVCSNNLTMMLCYFLFAKIYYCIDNDVDQYTFPI